MGVGHVKRNYGMRETFWFHGAADSVTAGSGGITIAVASGDPDAALFRGPSGSETTRGELACGRGFFSRHNLVFGGSVWITAMMQPCASAAKLQGGGPILESGIEAMACVVSPPPQIVVRQPVTLAKRAPKFSIPASVQSSNLRRRTQDDT